MWRFALVGAIVLSLALSRSPSWASQPVESILPNGLKVILVPEPKAPVVSVQVWYRVGSRDERSGKTGLSHLMEHMMFKGTARFGKGEFSRQIAEHGGNDNAFTTQDYTAYFENLAGDQIDLALELEADRLTGLMISDEEFALERDVVKEERRMRTDDDPYGTLFEQLYAAAYTAHPYQWPIIGWMNDLERLTAEDVRDYYRSHYVPANAVVVVVGDIKHRETLEKVRRAFETLTGPDAPVRPAIQEPAQLGERRVTVHKEAQLPGVVIGFHVPNYRHADAYALTVLSSLLTAGESSRLQRSLIYDGQIAVEVGGDYSALSLDPPLFYVYGMAHQGRSADEVERGLLEELERMKTAPPSARELAKAKNGLEADFILAQDSNFYRAMRIGMAEIVGAGQAYLEDYVRHIRGVSAADVVRVAKTYLTEKNRTVGVLAPIASATESANPAAENR